MRRRKEDADYLSWLRDEDLARQMMRRGPVLLPAGTMLLMGTGKGSPGGGGGPPANGITLDDGVTYLTLDDGVTYIVQG